MENDKLKFKIIFIFCIVIFIFTFLFLHFVNAQAAPQFLISWQAQDYVPAWYQGKVLAVNGAPVNVSFELIDNGKIADLSKTKVRWYVNDHLVLNENNGLGIKNLKINIPDSNGINTEIRIAVINYKGIDIIDKLIEIPVVGPEAVIDAPYYENKIKIGSSLIKLNPFFFNISDLNNLSVGWRINGQTPTGSGNPYSLNLNIGSDTPQNTQIDIAVSVKNALKQLEFASNNIQLQIK